MPLPSLIEACLGMLGAPPSGGLPGLLARTSFDRFELLQTPALWGHDPADDASCRGSSGGPLVMSAAGRRLVEAVEDVVANAETLLDIASLEPFASGEFAAAIRRGLARAARRGRPLTVRILYGRHGFEREGFRLQSHADFDAFVAGIAADVPSDASVRIHACTMKTSSHPTAPSWNHAKIVAADGRRAIVGGHNLWHDDYLSWAPVHDVSALVEGQAASEAHVFLDRLWDWVGGQFPCRAEGVESHSICWTGGRVEPAGAPAAVALPFVASGEIPTLAVGRLGSGVVADPRIANLGAAVAAVAFRQARETICISQMDMGFHWQGVNFWSADVVTALSDVLTDPARHVDVSLVVSEPGATTAAGGPYSFGTTITDIVAKMREAIGARLPSGRMRIAPLRISTHGECWGHSGRQLAFANHAKVWIVDERGFYVGSDNLYPHNLQEFGYVIESEPLARGLVADYWEPLWRHSSRRAVEVT